MVVDGDDARRGTLRQHQGLRTGTAPAESDRSVAPFSSCRELKVATLPASIEVEMGTTSAARACREAQ